MSYDPWGNVTTRSGIEGDLVISALQKSIRRGLAEEAAIMAYEMYITSEQFENKMWRRLQAIAVEDVGFGDLSAPVLINALNQMRKDFPYNDGDRPLFFIHAIRYLAGAKKALLATADTFTLDEIWRPQYDGLLRKIQRAAREPVVGLSSKRSQSTRTTAQAASP